MLKLKHIVNAVVVAEIDLSEGEFTIGRNHGNSLQLEDAVVSGEHAIISLQPNAYMPEMSDVSIKDLGSTNCTYVNNTVIKEQKLKHGDVIRIGLHEFKLFDDQSTVGTQTEYYVPED